MMMTQMANELTKSDAASRKGSRTAVKQVATRRRRNNRPEVKGEGMATKKKATKKAKKSVKAPAKKAAPKKAAAKKPAAKKPAAKKAKKK
jgi:hypothetical protein